MNHNLDMSSTLKAFILVLSTHLVTCFAVTCHEGHKVVLTRAPICNLCEKGTFIKEKNHKKTECDKCTQVRDANTEVVIRECRAEEDALIECIAGFFRDGGTCNNCTVCEAGHEIKTCDSHRDTICCSSDNYYVNVDNDGHKMCKERTLPCRQGQFSVSEHNCTSCPPGTYMADNHHSYNACISCQQLPNNHEIDEYVATVCNITCSSSSVGGCHSALTPDTGKDIHIVDLNKTGNVSDEMSTATSLKCAEEVFHKILFGVYAVGFIVLLSGFVLVKCVSVNWECIVRIKWIKLLKEYLEDKGGVLAMTMFAVIFVLVVIFLVIFIVRTENLHFLLHVVVLILLLILILGTKFMAFQAHSYQLCSPNQCHKM